MYLSVNVATPQIKAVDPAALDCRVRDTQAAGQEGAPVKSTLRQLSENGFRTQICVFKVACTTVTTVRGAASAPMQDSV